MLYKFWVIIYKSIRRIYNNISIVIGKLFNILRFKLRKKEINNISKQIKPKQITKANIEKISIESEIEQLKDGYIGLWVDTLDKGGIEQVVAFLAEGLKKNNINVKILCNISGGFVANNLRESGFDVYVFNNNKEEFETFLIRNKPLLLSSHYIHNFLDVPQKLDIKVIETIHNMYAYFDNFAWQDELKRAQYFNKMIAVSDLVKQYYISWNKQYNPDDIIVIGNAGDPKRCLPTVNKLSLKQELNISEDSYIFLNTASFDPRKNQLGLISAFELMYNNISKDITLILLGNTQDEKYKKEMIRYKNTLKSRDNILILEFRKDIANILNISDCFVLPSYIEGWSIAATESIYAGMPIIHSKMGSGTELTKQGEYGILISNPAKKDLTKLNARDLYVKTKYRYPQNTKELYQAMVNIYINRDYWFENRELIKQNSIEEFNSELMLNKYIRAYAKLIKIGDKDNDKI